MGRKKHKNWRKKDTAHTDAVKTKLVETENSAAESSITASEGLIQSAVEKEITFTKYCPNKERMRGREYYVHSLCQVCKKDLQKRYSCERCGLLSYCSPEHRHLHWPEHAELCVAVQSVCKARGATHILEAGVHTSPDAFRVLRMRNMQDCELAVARALESWEKEMLIFPHVCGQCYQYKPELLVVCTRCSHSGFCKEHLPQSHDQWCAHLLRYKEVVKDQNKFGVSCPTIPASQLLSSTLKNLTNIDNVFKNLQNSISKFEFFELTEIVTYPLTVLNALLTSNNSELLHSENIVLHVVGAERDFETKELVKWEYYVLHLLPNLKNLEIEFIGPELKTVNPEGYKVCSLCVSARKSISFKCETGLYHELTAKSKADLVCVFNPGLYRVTGFNGLDSWHPSIVKMFANNCPVLTTSYTKREIFLDVDRVNSIHKVRLDKEPTLNPFSSLKPSLNFVSEEDSPVIFKNHFYCIMSKASSNDVI